jgi:hypothetical protein
LSWPSTGGDEELALGIDSVDGVVSEVGVELGVAAVEGDGVFGGPASELWVVVACAEAGEAGVGVEEAAGEAEGVEEGVAALGGDAAEGVEVAGLDAGPYDRIGTKPSMQLVNGVALCCRT